MKIKNSSNDFFNTQKKKKNVLFLRHVFLFCLSESKCSILFILVGVFPHIVPDPISLHLLRKKVPVLNSPVVFTVISSICHKFTL